MTLGRAMVLTLVLPRSAETEQARILGQDTLERYQRVLGPDHPHTLRLAQVVDSPTAEQQQHQTDLLWFLRPHMTATRNEDQVQR